jgi:hypothetical protein
MATTGKRSLVSRAGAAARKVVGRPTKSAAPAKKAASAKKAVPLKKVARAKKSAPA